MPIHIQRAHLPDLDTVVGLNAEVQALHVTRAPERYHRLEPTQVRAYFEQLLKREDADIALLVEDGTAVGYVICLLVERPASPFSQASRILYVDQIGIREGHQGKGFGRALMDHAMACAERLTCHRVELDVAGFNEDALAFYRRLGYRPWQYRLFQPVVAATPS